MIEAEFAKEMITLRMIGMVTDEDWDHAVLAFQQSLGDVFGLHLRPQESGTLSVLMDWERLEEWKQGARTACTLFCMGYQDLVRRIAIIGSDEWKDEGERLTDIYKNAQFRFFQAPERGAAVAWVTGR
ncbi:MAG: STAS/SEC14 domain-containing protein [Rhodospirillales bacterium]|nr:STAS/SEC14 domain-containing protein [Rhodospirillales bacterium]